MEAYCIELYLALYCICCTFVYRVSFLFLSFACFFFCCFSHISTFLLRRAPLQSDFGTLHWNKLKLSHTVCYEVLCDEEPVLWHDFGARDWMQFMACTQRGMGNTDPCWVSRLVYCGATFARVQLLPHCCQSCSPPSKLRGAYASVHLLACTLFLKT